MKLTQNLNRHMASDGSLLQGKFAAGLIRKKDQGLIMLWTELGLQFYLEISPSDLSHRDIVIKVWRSYHQQNFLDLFSVFSSFFLSLFSLKILWFFCCLQNVGSRWKRDLSNFDGLKMSFQLKDQRRGSVDSWRDASPLSSNQEAHTFLPLKKISQPLAFLFYFTNQAGRIVGACHMI